jgi:hypothetical protein
MARRFVRASQHRFNFTVSDFDFSGDFTTLIWVKNISYSGTTPSYFMSGGVFASPNSLNLFTAPSGNTNDWRVFILDSDGDGPQSSGGGGTTPTASERVGLWTPVIVRRTSGLVEHIVLSRSNTIQSGGSFGPTFTLSNLQIGGRSDLNANRFLDGELAHLAHFTTSLNNSAVDELLGGENPTVVANRYSANLARYFPMEESSGNIIDIIGGAVGTAVNSPRIGETLPPVRRFITVNTAGSTPITVGSINNPSQTVVIRL